jgi:hypothetical protein
MDTRIPAVLLGRAICDLALWLRTDQADLAPVRPPDTTAPPLRKKVVKILALLLEANTVIRPCPEM